MKFKQILSLCLTVVLLMLVTACTATDKNISKQDDAFHIVTSFYPMYVFTANIAQGIEKVTVENMTEPQTGCLHDYELSPADMKILERADVFVINGAEMESFLDEVEKTFPKLPIIEASKGLDLIKNENGEINPHVWVGISGAIAEVENIAEGLAGADTAHAAQYKANATAYLAKLDAQKSKMHEALKDLSSRDIITFHEAFPYFAQEFDLNIVSVIEREPGTEPLAGELDDTINIIQKNSVKAVFVEPQYSQRAAETIAAATGVGIYTLDPMVTGPKNADPESYIKTMEQNLKTLIEALK